jgi:hypothetical protein
MVKKIDIRISKSIKLVLENVVVLADVRKQLKSTLAPLTIQVD